LDLPVAKLAFSIRRTGSVIPLPELSTDVSGASANIRMSWQTIARARHANLKIVGKLANVLGVEAGELLKSPGVGKLLSVVVADDKAGVQFLDRPRREAAGLHGIIARRAVFLLSTGISSAVSVLENIRLLSSLCLSQRGRGRWY
jgi:hypothetical protein